MIIDKTIGLKAKLELSCAIFAVSALVFTAAIAQAQITGAGSTLAQNVFADFNTKLGKSVGGAQYAATGSSAGIAQLNEGKVDFAATDWPLTRGELDKAGYGQVAMGGDAIVVAANLPGVSSVKLSGDALVDIFQGKLTQWNQGLAASNNAGVTMPALAIKATVRADGSASTRAFTNYLSRVNTRWRREFNSDFTVNWPAGDTSVRGTSGMINAIKSTPGAIGYVGLADAQKAGLTVVQLMNSAGAYVTATKDTVNTALTAANWDSRTGAADLDGVSGANSWPITVVTYVVFRRNGTNAANVRKYLNAVLTDGDAVLSARGFFVLPASGKQAALSQVKA